jgi:simple sugar transport system permease protein
MSDLGVAEDPAEQNDDDPTETRGDGSTDAEAPGYSWLAGPALSLGRWLLAVAAALVIFSAFLVVKGASPLEVFEGMWDSASSDGFGETFIRMTPFLFAALAVVVPARAGLFNIGGEGQLVMGAVGAMGMARAIGFDSDLPGALVLILLAGAVAGALWAALPALLLVGTKANEAITSLLLNYVAGLVLTWLVFEPWKDPASLGQAYSEELGSGQTLPVVWGNRVHAGIFLGVVAAFAVWAIFRYTRWGFMLRVVGGNREAARRAGFSVGWLTITAFLVGGALAGLGGAVELAGVESRLRPDILVGWGFIGFLASWLVRHHPLKVIGSSFLLAFIAVGGTGLKLTSGLSAGAVEVLMALLLLAILGWGQGRKVQA